MDVSRRQFLATATASSIPLAGCIEGELADTSYDCEVEEPSSRPKPSRPSIGDSSAPVTVEIYHDYSERVSGIFGREVLGKILAAKADTGEAKFEFYDLPVPGDKDWAYQLASVGRYVFAEYGVEAYREYLLKIYEHQEDPSWQIVGDIADSIGADPCTVISHGSWKTYEEESKADRKTALSRGVDEVPGIIVNGNRLHDLAPVSESYQPIVDAINQHQETE
jgi:protein-disulfide isomerase